jgi:hypothetical protein
VGSIIAYWLAESKSEEISRKDAKEDKRRKISFMISETRALRMLGTIRNEFRSEVGVYERNALACKNCSTPGACCLDEHFVNVRITRLEGVAIRNELDKLGDELRDNVLSRVDQVVDRYELNSGVNRTYSCPLYDRKAGCLVHETAKPLPCIHHACYEKKDDLPPDDLLDKAESSVERLNQKVYGSAQVLLPLPIAIQKVLV